MGTLKQGFSLFYVVGSAWLLFHPSLTLTQERKDELSGWWIWEAKMRVAHFPFLIDEVNLPAEKADCTALHSVMGLVGRHSPCEGHFCLSLSLRISPLQRWSLRKSILPFKCNHIFRSWYLDLHYSIYCALLLKWF